MADKMNDYNEEQENLMNEVNNAFDTDDNASVVAALQDLIDSLEAENEELTSRLLELESRPAQAQPSDLVDIANNVSQAWRNGHPSKLDHLNRLLAALGVQEIR